MGNLLVNFDQLQDLVDDGSTNTPVSITSKLELVEDLLSDTKHLLQQEKGRTNKDFYDLIDDLSDNVRGISNNFEDLVHGCKRYIDKMDPDRYVQKQSLNIMINEDSIDGINYNFRKEYGYIDRIKDQNLKYMH